MSTEFARWMRDVSFACGLVLTIAVASSGQDGPDAGNKKTPVTPQTTDNSSTAKTESTKTSTSTQSSVEIRSEIAVPKNGEPAKPITRQLKVVQQSQSNSSGKAAITKGRVRIVGPDGVIKEFDVADLSDPATTLPSGTEGYSIKTYKTPDGATRVMTVIIGNDGTILAPQPKTATSPETAVQKPSSADSMRVHKAVSIGVQLQPLSEALKSQLQLTIGLRIEKVMPDSPALEAGLQPHDIILMAGESKVTDHPTLQKVIHESEDKPLKLTILRAGQKQYVTVTPRKQTLILASPETQHAEIVKLLEQLQSEGNPQIRLQLIRPGIMAKDVEELQKVRQQLTENLKMKQRDKELRERSLPSAKSTGASDLKSEVEALRKQVQELQKSIKALQSQSPLKADTSGKQKKQE